MNPRVAVIDIGSNSIKVLVAESTGCPFGIAAIHEETLEVRISQGISGSPPMLQPDRIAAGVAAVEQLWHNCQQFGPLKAVRIVATSAVRSAANGGQFMKAVEAATGTVPETLSGTEEADGIANGVRTDPDIEEKLDDFTVFDLGGGSLELIRFEHHGVTDRTSLPLGSVRLTEQFIADSSQPVPEKEATALSRHVREHILATGFPVRAPLVGCSGGLSALRKVLASRGSDGPVFQRKLVESITRSVLSQDLARRIEEAGLPPRRADIFPAALLTFLVIMDLGEASEIIHSYHNLRYGLAWSLLQVDEPAS